MTGLGVDFIVDTGNTFSEDYSPETPYDEVPILMSEGKSHGYHRKLYDNEILITADTMVILSDEILGKPHDREDAQRMLHEIGRVHV